MAAYDIRPYRPGDEESIVRCFNVVFGENDPSFRPRTLADWRWAYEENPAGRRVFVATHEGEVVAHYASYPYRVRIVGGETTFAQILDSFVHPDHRRGLKKPGLFVEIGLAFLEATCGPDKDVVNFGWPIENAWRMGEKYFGYEVVRTQGILGREPGPGLSELPARVEVLDGFDEQALWLYDRCSGVWGASIVRDEGYLGWRYTKHPRHEYLPLGVRDEEGILRGLAVYRFGDWLVPRMGLLMDWLVPPDEPDVADLLHEALLARARADGATSLAAIFPEWAPWFADFQERGWLVYPSDYDTVAIQHHPTYEMHWLRDHWWYQLGETDLV